MMCEKRRILSKIKKKIKGEEGYFEALLTVVIFFFLMSVMFALSSPFIVREKISIISRRTVDKISYDGKVDSSTKSFVNGLITKANINEKNPKYNFSGAIRADGKIQLRDEFTFKITAEDNIKLNALDNFEVTIPITKEQSGISEVFYKSSEL